MAHKPSDSWLIPGLCGWSRKFVGGCHAASAGQASDYTEGGQARHETGGREGADGKADT